jgi:BirA family biotin operon repressor/biotin-[acetyl-CoA-carboxylase] ligase
VSAGAALAGLLAPLTELHYAWPNAVLLNRERIGHVQLTAPPLKNDYLEWLAVGLALNLRAPVAETEHEMTNVCATGAPEVSAVAVLESFARHFLSWINRWADQGFGPVRRHWLQRALGLGEEMTISLPRENFTGTLTQVDEAGAAHLRSSSGAERILTVADFYDILAR